MAATEKDVYQHDQSQKTNDYTEDEQQTNKYQRSEALAQNCFWFKSI
jgi:hypothetical protein